VTGPGAGVLAGWVVSVDLWGTLITYGDRDAEAAWRLREFEAVLREFGHAIHGSRLRDVLTQARALTLQKQRMTGSQPTAHEQVTAVLAALGVGTAPEMTDILVTVHTHAVLRACPEVIPGAHAALAAIRAAGGLLTLTSNTLATPASVHRQILDGLDLLAPFDDLVFSCDIGVAKPRPEVFTVVAERQGTTTAHVVHVGNDWRTDVLGALEAGCRAVFFNPRGKPPRPQAPGIGHLSELAAVLVTACAAHTLA
jgi:FMN phosphatase YigB (HAD superfamily)